ncbi:uncharacterized protein PgNI_12161 [Pyricularia grisea]|uniref:Uncharacterized protein n=1 Tax=Pyricularia grisea TaxID=148305 RepID=A0A6P8AQS8_PYRGI|nr:uncharacterized protein PgNI_12161 [Pyricularia grisea]TLD04425.1 hypothetical protein PgNI_12161 [Pyricularia grisea]
MNELTSGCERQRNARRKQRRNDRRSDDAPRGNSNARKRWNNKPNPLHSTIFGTIYDSVPTDSRVFENRAFLSVWILTGYDPIRFAFTGPIMRVRKDA